MEEFLTAVTTDVDAYWTQVFKDSGLQEPRVSYDWIPAGQTAASVCGDSDGTLGDSAAAYCPGDDTIYISQKFASDLYSGNLDGSLPGAAQGYGHAGGDFAVAYVIAHEYGHEVQDELGLFEPERRSVPTMNFELQADCYAGTWAKSANEAGRLEDGDVDEALQAALAVGDFDTSSPGHHGTPEQRHKLFKWRTPPVLIDEQVLGRGDALNPRVEPLQKVFDGWAVPRSLLGHCLDYGEQVLRAM